jgi:RNA polymerase sigma-70 factor (ECF subfamily)
MPGFIEQQSSHSIERQSSHFDPILCETFEDKSRPTAELPMLAEPIANADRDVPDSSEEALIRLSRQGDTRAFGELIQRHYKTCLKRAVSMMRNQSDAEDEVQNTCWKAFHRLDQYRGDGTFAAWLSRIVENQCLMRIRVDRQLHFVYLDESTESNVRVELVGQTLNPEDELGDQQVEDLLRREISRIPPLLREVMLLRDVQHLPMRIVAEQLSLSVPAAKSRLMRARAELRSRLAKHCGRRGPSTLMQKAKYHKSAYASAS